jgi:hypothetical protein
MNKFKIGDKVKIINYGSLFYISKPIQPQFEPMCKAFPVFFEDNSFIFVDTCQYMVGRIGTIYNIEYVNKMPQYSLRGIEGKISWYGEDQLELIKT